MVSVVMAKLGVPTVYALTRVLFPEHPAKSTEMETIERTWRRYAADGVLPSVKFVNSQSASRAEAKAPGCLRCLSSPAWEILKDRDIERLPLLYALHDLGPHIAALLFDPDLPRWEDEPQLREFNAEIQSGLEELTGFEAIEVFVLLAAYARAIQSEALGNAVTFTYMERRPALSEDPELTTHFRELFTAVDRHMPVWMRTSSTNRFDVLLPWQGQMPDKAISDPDQPPTLLELAMIAANWKD